MQQILNCFIVAGLALMIVYSTSEFEAMASLGCMVAQFGPGIEDIVRQRKPQDPNLWYAGTTAFPYPSVFKFLFHKDSAAYQQYLQLIDQCKLEMARTDVKEDNYKPEDIYEPEMATDDDFDRHNNKPEDTNYRFTKTEKHQLRSVMSDEEDPNGDSSRRKRKSRWGSKDTSIPPPTVIGDTFPIQIPLMPSINSHSSIKLSRITKNDPNLIQYVLNSYGSMNLSEEEWKKAEENFKVNLVYQEMLRKKEETNRLAQVGKNKYEYDSDEETDGGTWEHKLRIQEMSSTQQWATDLTRNAEGKHHIGDFLPPEELKRFLEKNSAIKDDQPPELSDYKEFKLKEDNVGFQMLQKLGWSEGQGLGINACGIIDPVNKASIRDQNQGLGVTNPSGIDNADDEYDAYRKRMMLAYRFRPNPLNNPRRPYY